MSSLRKERLRPTGVCLKPAYLPLKGTGSECSLQSRIAGLKDLSSLCLIFLMCKMEKITAIIYRMLNMPGYVPSYLPVGTYGYPYSSQLPTLQTGELRQKA